MSVDLSDHPTDLDSTDAVLTEFRDTQDEFENFFGDVFDQLQSLSVELFARHKCLELRAEHASEAETEATERRDQFRQILEAINQLQSEIRAGHEEARRVWAEICETHDRAQQSQPGMHEMQEELRRVEAEFVGLRGDLDRQRGELQERQQTVQSQLAQLETLAARLLDNHAQKDDSSQQQAAWQRERAELQAQVDSLRNRETQQSESLAEHRRQAAQQQAELGAELKRMRSLMEILTRQMSEEPPHAGHGDADGPASPDAAALGSVLAQFEMIQRDMAQRRSGKSRGPKGKE